MALVPAKKMHGHIAKLIFASHTVQRPHDPGGGGSIAAVASGPAVCRCADSNAAQGYY